MNVNIQKLAGNWNLGFALDKHITSSVYIGDNEHGHPLFSTIRTEVGEALFQLKYRAAFQNVPIIGAELVRSLIPLLPSVSLVVPMPPSRLRKRQPVLEIAQDVANRMGVPYSADLLTKGNATEQMKDITSREEKVRLLSQALNVNDVLGPGNFDVLLVDDLYDTGSSLEAATAALKAYAKVGSVFVAVVTRRGNA